MKPQNTVETKRLTVIDNYIDESTNCTPANKMEHRLQLLEATASRIGGFDLEEFQTSFGVKSVIPFHKLIDDAGKIVQLLDEIGVHPSLALSALAREHLDDSSQKSSGAYYTDFRLAQHMARSIDGTLEPGMKVIDPASGTGILLAAVSAAACGSDRILANEWLQSSIFAADLSPMALRGARLSLASFTNDIDALKGMNAKLLVQDSLLTPDSTWRSLSPEGFDLVIANPPWEKVKLSRHEYIKGIGKTHKYGSSYTNEPLSGYSKAKAEKAQFAAELLNRYPSLVGGEPDLYVAFLELIIQLTRDNGRGNLLLPAGLIRSLHTKQLRSKLIHESSELAFTVMDNRSRFFAIDTRFKFLMLNYTKTTSPRSNVKSIKLSHASADVEMVHATPPVNISISSLKRLRSDLTLPEVRNTAEWRLFRRLQINGKSSKDPSSPWHTTFCREVDMTHGRKKFVKSPNPGALPVIEGRMVQPHRLGCKAYHSGEGRGAKWQYLSPGSSRIAPQFWMPQNATTTEMKTQTNRFRAGFCDIAGQTNERSMMAAPIPPRVICGNKVPTVMFPNDTTDDRIYLWLAIVNSIPFDWLLRRVITTSVNYFLLQSIRLPNLDKESLPARRLIDISRQLSEFDKNNIVTSEAHWKFAALRAEADVLVANAYGCTITDLKLMLKDFPLLDRGQPSLPREANSTITKDLLLSEWTKKKGIDDSKHTLRLNAAKSLGAIAYLPAENSDHVKQSRGVIHE